MDCTIICWRTALLRLTGMLECTAEVVHNYWVVVNASPSHQVSMAVFIVGVTHIFRLVFQGWFRTGMAAVCFWLLSIDGSRKQLLDGDKKRDVRGSHSTFYHSRVQREVEGTSQNSLNQRRFHVLWFQWLNHRPAPTEPCVPHPIPPSETPTGPAMS